MLELTEEQKQIKREKHREYMRKIIVNFGKNIDIDYIKYESDDTYNYFICLDDYYMGSIKYIKIDKKFKKKY